ncbi:sce7726 family protein [Aeromonas dhakensis]|uniref:sce7726 family protein n=1 Tax=Aeromonas dhakensis TaxID=196024 RepID=UPI0029D5EC4E|nr:sce7726 family protein [Aeromonas dhakensis]MDX7739918.1 sce7726 family protein [Aeromonas dhakensis]
MNIYKMKFLEGDIKALIIQSLLGGNYNNDEPPIVINEFTIGNYARRADLVLIKNNELHAYEVKSEYDSLVRLEGQISKYLEFFDKVTVVLTRKHINKAKTMLPINVQIMEVHEGKIKIVRRGRKVIIKNKNSFISLMTCAELKSLASFMDIKVDNYRRKTLELALLSVNISVLRDYCLMCIQKKYKQQYMDFLKITNGRYIESKDISQLSIHKKSNKNNINTTPKSLINILNMIE